MTTRRLIFLVVMTGAILACAVQVATPVPVMTKTAVMTTIPKSVMTTTPDSVMTATILQPVVTVRESPGGQATGNYLAIGNKVVILSCLGEWCKIQKPAGWVYRGCLAEVAGELGCQSR